MIIYECFIEWFKNNLWIRRLKRELDVNYEKVFKYKIFL